MRIYLILIFLILPLQLMADEESSDDLLGTIEMSAGRKRLENTLDIIFQEEANQAKFIEKGIPSTSGLTKKELANLAGKIKKMTDTEGSRLHL